MASDDVTLPEGASDVEGTSLEPPRHLGRYSIGHVLGTGGMGIVLAAHDPELDRAVALKLMHQGEAEHQRRLLREAQAMARLRHPNVVTVHDVGVCDGRVFVAMELIEGTTLRQWLRAARRPWREIIARFIAAGHGLAAAHAAGIIHRDFKADNVLVGDDGTVRVADFGLAGAEQDHVDGQIAGTPAYMAPEQHDGQPAGAPADQFAFAAALWEALCGTRPFAGATGEELGEAKREYRIAAATGPAPRWAFALLRRALAPDPADRHPSIDVLVRGLERGLRRRRLAITAGVGAALVGVTAAAAIALTGRDDGPSCRLAAAEVERAWNPTIRAGVERAFAASPRPHAAATSTRVAAALDRHAAALGAARVAACEATHVRGEQSAIALDRRMACIDQRIDAMGALVTLFGRGADDELVDRAFEAVAALPAADGCAGPALADRPPPPPAIRDRVAAARTRLSEANALRAAGRFADAAAAFETLAAEARALAYAPLTAEVLAGRARAIDDQDDAAAGDRAYQQAAAAAAAAADDRLIAEAWIGQLGLLGDEGGKPADALGRLGFAEVAVARAGGDALHEDFLVVRADVYEGLGRYAEARRDLEAARASIEARGAGSTFAATRILQRLGTMLWQMGENDAALALDRNTLAMYTELLGPEHPKVGQMLNNVAIRLDEVGHFDEARRLLDRSLSIKERTLGPDHPSVAYTLNNLGMVTNHLGQDAEATAFNERALAIREKALGPEHPLTASSLSNLGMDRTAAGRPEEGLALHRRALAIREKINGPEHPSLAPTLNGMARSLLDLGRLDEALAAARRSLAIREKALGPEHPHVGRSLMILVDIHFAMKRGDQACAAIDRALAITEKAEGAHSADLTEPLTGRADCRLERGDAAAALADAERALAVIAEHKIPAHFAARVHFIRARALWPSDRAAAAAAIRAALDGYRDAPPSVRPELVELERWRKAHPGT